MLKRSILLLSLGLWLLTPTAGQASISRTESFRVSVTIPVLVGVNDNQDPTKINRNLVKDDQDIFVERTTRNNHPVLLKTIVAK